MGEVGDQLGAGLNGTAHVGHNVGQNGVGHGNASHGGTTPKADYDFLIKFLALGKFYGSIFFLDKIFLNPPTEF